MYVFASFVLWATSNRKWAKNMCQSFGVMEIRGKTFKIHGLVESNFEVWDCRVWQSLATTTWMRNQIYKLKDVYLQGLLLVDIFRSDFQAGRRCVQSHEWQVIDWLPPTWNEVLCSLSWPARYHWEELLNVALGHSWWIDKGLRENATEAIGWQY